MDALRGTRLGFVLLCIGAAALMAWRFERVARTVRAFFFEPTLAVNLGLLRAVIFYTLLLDASAQDSVWYAGLPRERLTLPQGWSWLGDLVPLGASTMLWAKRSLLVSATLATIGLFTRPAAMLAAPLAVYVLGIPNFYSSKISHISHVIVLSALVLAASPCGDGFSLDALIRRLRGKPALPAHEAYTVPIRFCWLLMGTMYLFPGLWKLWEGGDLWLSGVKLKVELFNKWATLPRFHPAFRVDRYPWLLAMLGTSTLLLEIGFFFALFKRKTRVVAAFAATCFHLGIWLSMDIRFNPYHPLVLLFDFPDILPTVVARRLTPIWSQFKTRARGLVPTRWVSTALEEPRLARSIGGSFVMGSLLVFAMFIAGFSPIDSWPIAVYPRFANRTEKVRTSAVGLRFKVVTPAGVERELEPAAASFGESTMRSALRRRRRDKPSQVRRELAVVADMLRQRGDHFEPGTRLLVYRYRFPVDPDERDKATPQLSLVAETYL
jgi:hypothetical protein